MRSLAQSNPAVLALEDGCVFRGTSFGADGERVGEVVFNTSMTGYQEVLTDPSYSAQIVVMTYPLVGNYGTNDEDLESRVPQVEGFVVREVSGIASNWRHDLTLQGFMRKHGVVAMEGIDTRALARHIRTRGAMKGVLSTVDLDPEALARKARRWEGLVGRDIVQRVTVDRQYHWHELPRREFELAEPNFGRKAKQLSLYFEGSETSDASNVWDVTEAGPFRRPFRVVAMDFGVKHNILRNLTARGCQVLVVPAACDAGRILKLRPDGVFLSNGPGDPEPVTYAIETIRSLLGTLPIFGICLGHQLLGLALGGKTYKLKFGHRGVNHPVLNLETGRVEITAQNHGFAVDPDTLPPEVRITHVNLNDQTNEGFRHTQVPAYCVQYHPEASPGPHDSGYLFDEFVQVMRERAG